MTRKLRVFLFSLVLAIMISPLLPIMASEGSQNLKIGSSGKEVSELQQLLKEMGFFPESQKVTGYYGWITYGAVAALEKKHGLRVNGQVGADEWEILNKSKMPKTVLGYYTVDYEGDKLSHNSLSTPNLPINYVAMFDYRIDGKGNLIGSTSTEGIRLAKKKGAKTLMVVHNISRSIDTQSAYSAISVSQNRKQLVNNITKKVAEHGYDGVNIDLEGIPAAGREGFNDFLSELSSAFKKDSKILTVAVPAKTSDDSKSNWTGAYDYKTIGRLAEHVVIMSYDEHWTNGPPGPVASVPWVTKVLNYTVGVIPAHKVLMGIPAYGYDWPHKQNGKAVMWKNIPRLVSQYGSVVQWDNNKSTPYFIYWKNGVRHEVWFENRYSLAIKLGMVNKYGLGGIAFWRLGFEETSFWETVKRKLL